jgi:hypothetical protein
MAYKQKQAIRQAIACREYEKVKRLWAEYIGGLRSECARGALTQTQMDEARQLLEWARVTMLCQRAHVQQRLRGLQVASLYGQPAETRAHRRFFSGKL